MSLPKLLSTHTLDEKVQGEEEVDWEEQMSSEVQEIFLKG